MVDITNVDQLLLHKTIHTRRRRVHTNEWKEERITP